MEALIVTAALIGVIILLVYKYLTWYHGVFKKMGLDGPKPSIIFGNFYSLFTGKQPVVYDVDEVYKQYKITHRVIGVFLSRNPIILILDPELAQDVLVKKFGSYRGNVAANWIYDRKNDKYASQSPFLTSDDSWKVKRSEILCGLSQYRLNSALSIWQGCAKKLGKYLLGKTEKGNAIVETKNLSFCFASNVMGEFIFGIETNSLDKPEELNTFLQITHKWLEHITNSVDMYYKLLVLPWLRCFFQQRLFSEQTDRFFSQITKDALEMRERDRKSQNRMDFLNYMRQLQEKKNITHDQIVGHILTTMLNGFETVAVILSHTIFYLAHHPEYQEKLIKEIQENIDDNGQMNYQKLSSLQYLHQCIIESIRMLTAVSFYSRICTKPTELDAGNGLVIPISVGQIVAVPAYSYHHDESYFPEPNQYHPERFNNESYLDLEKKGIFMPFGYGPRICVGMHLGLLEVKTCLVEIFKCYRVKCCEKTIPEKRPESHTFIIVYPKMSSSLELATTVLLLCFSGTLRAEKVDWWEAATFYQIYPRSFMDSNGDGVGDLNGIISKLGYLKSIGVDATWLSPIYESPMADNGYDISNFTKIDPVFGTMDDFDLLLKKAHELGMKILLDFVPNHSSDECEWFQKSIRREPIYDDFYVWDDGKIDPRTGARIPPSNWLSESGGSAWTWNEERQQYYFHQFLAKQPDFNLTNPIVRQRLLDIMEFWLDRGVDAFRIDAIPFLFEKRFKNGTFADNPPHTRDNQLNQPGAFDLMYYFRDFLDNYQQINGGDTRFMLGEAYASTEGLSRYVSNGTRNGIHMPMHFKLVYINNTISARVLERVANNWISIMWTKYRLVNWVVGNHDNSRVASRMGQQRADLMTIIIHALPGASITYNGEEIGMSNWETGCLKNCNFRDKARTPMQWDTSLNAGFSTGNSTWLPINPNYELINVEKELKTWRSTLQIFKEMVKLKNTPAFRAYKDDGAWEYGALNEQVFHVMRTDSITEEYRALANFGDQIEYVEGLTNETMEYVVLNKYSPHIKGETVDLSEGIFLMPYESFILRRSLCYSTEFTNKN